MTQSKLHNIGSDIDISAHSSFNFLGRSRIAALNLDVLSYEHKVTACRHYHLAADNDENVFLVALKTVPTDSTGVAHILEHTVLCGSEKYPVRDPFFMMLRRSLNTFMNAFTSSDWTAYPFSSQNRKDFDNLLQIYLDAVFFPRIAELDFRQEGHRLEFAEKENPLSELTFKGVVFNEMKGAMSSETSVLYHTISEHLFPTNTYHYNSGGDPACITDLSYQQLIAFFKKHYHPSNALFFTFGNIPAAEHQAVFDKEVLSRFEGSTDLPEISLEQRYSSPKTVEAFYPVDGDLKNKTHVTLSWLLGESSHLEKSLKAHLLTSVLLSNSASPLRHMLETSKLGLAPSPMCGLEDTNREMIFSCGLEGSEADDAEKIEQEILACLEKVKKDGVPHSQIEAVLHQLELNQREIGGDRYPYGLQLILAALSPAIHGAPVPQVLDLDPAIEKLREEIKNPQFIADLIDKLLLNNKHRLRLSLRPDNTLAEKMQQAEKEKLASIQSNLGEQEKQNIIQQSLALAQRQNQKEDENILPKVGREDVPKQLKFPEQHDESIAGLKSAFFNQGTNGLLYQQLIVELPQFSEQEQQLLSLYCRCFGELGVADQDYMQTQLRQAQHTGGIHASYSYKSFPNSAEVLKGYFVLSAKALNRKTKELNELLKDTFKTIHFDEKEKIKELVAQSRLAKEQSVTSNGHALAMTAASSGMSVSAHLNHQLSGLAAIQSFKALDDSLKEEQALEHLTQQLTALHNKVLNMPLQFLLVAEEKIKSQVTQLLESHWQNHQSLQSDLLDLPASWQGVKQVKQMWLCNTQVNFCAKAYPAVDIEHKDAPALTVLGGFLRNGCLHKLIREQGGAYGGGASFDAASRCFRFFSYRDPRLVDTFKDFDQSIMWMLTEQHSEQKLEEAILGVVSDLDKPGSPAGQAKQCFHSSLYGRTPEKRQQFRQQILDLTLDDLLRVTRSYLKDKPASFAVVTNQENKKLANDLCMEVFSII